MSDNSGRPTKKQSLENKKILQKYFLNGSSSEFTSMETGIHINTVRKYFKKFSEIFEKINAEEFDAKSKENKIRTIILYDQTIEELIQYKNKLNILLQKISPTDKNLKKFQSLSNEFLKTQNMLFKFYSIRNDIQNRMTARDQVILEINTEDHD